MQELPDFESYVALRRYSPETFFTLATQRQMYLAQQNLGSEFFATYRDEEALQHG
jgi:hypothetical protein